MAKKKTVKDQMREEIPKRKQARHRKAAKDVISGKTGNKTGLIDQVANQRDIDRANATCKYCHTK